MGQPGNGVWPKFCPILVVAHFHLLVLRRSLHAIAKWLGPLPLPSPVQPTPFSTIEPERIVSESEQQLL